MAKYVRERAGNALSRSEHAWRRYLDAFALAAGWRDPIVWARFVAKLRRRRVAALLRDCAAFLGVKHSS